MPRVESLDPAGTGSAPANFRKMKAVEQSNIPIFENEQIMEAVAHYLDLATLKTQFIKTKADSEFNQLLKL